MYTTCMFCTKPLGSNEVVETFPVGRRLAFDAAKGRLWVVCRKCQRWNLTPVEERWEAVEACERIFRDTRMRASTENIGIARHAEGLDLVRIGAPSRPEFAAWRYGDQFGRRMRRAVLGVAGSIGGYFVLTSVPIAVPAALATAGTYSFLAWLYLRPMAKVRVGGKPTDGVSVAPDQVAVFRLTDLQTIRLLPDDDKPGFGIQIRKGIRKAWFNGEDARRVASAIMPRLNEWGGSRSSVQRAVHEIEASGHPSRFLTHMARYGCQDWRGRSGRVKSFPGSTRLALEMALHEEQERRALEGELWILERAWKEAEEIAAIADNLLLPAGTAAFFDRHGEGS